MNRSLMFPEVGAVLSSVNAASHRAERVHADYGGIPLLRETEPLKKGLVVFRSGRFQIDGPGTGTLIGSRCAKEIPVRTSCRHVHVDACAGSAGRAQNVTETRATRAASALSSNATQANECHSERKTLNSVLSFASLCYEIVNRHASALGASWMQTGTDLMPGSFTCGGR